MPPRKLLHLITGTWRTRHDGLVLEVACNVRGQVGRGSVAARLIFFQGLGDDRFDVAAIASADLAEFGGIFLAYGMDRFIEFLADRVGHPPRQKLVENHAECVNVATGVESEWIGKDLLW